MQAPTPAQKSVRRPDVMQPIPFKWDAASRCMLMSNHYARIAARQYEDGEVYLLEPSKVEHDALRRAFFAQLRQVFKSLPEHLEERFPSELHLRKWLLVRVGYCDEANYAFETYKDAETFALAARKLDEFAVILLRRSDPEEGQPADGDYGGVVLIRTAKSQKRGVVKPDEAKEVIDKVLNAAAALIGTTRADMRQQIAPPPKQITGG